MAQANTKKEAKELKDQARETADATKEAGKDAAHEMKDRAKEGFEKMQNKAESMAESAGKTADSAAGTVGAGLKRSADFIDKHAPEGGPVGSAAQKMTESIDEAGAYLQEKGVTGAADDLTKLIKKNPIPSVLVGVGLGFLLAQMTTRR